MSELFYLVFYSLPGVIKMYGTHLKACSAMVRLRLYDVLTMLPPATYESKSKHCYQYVCVCVCVIQMTEHVKKKLCVKLIYYTSSILVCIPSHSLHRFLPITYIQPSRSIVMLCFCCCIFMGGGFCCYFCW